MAAIHTPGHSTHPIEAFLDLLARHSIARVVDVRGQPHSRFDPQYDRAPFAPALAEAGVGYLWHGDRLSGRPREREL